MAYLVARGQPPKKVKRTFENLGKMTITEARRAIKGQSIKILIFFQ